MTAVPPDPNEPPPPQRGLTREERGRDVSDAQAEAEAETSKVNQYLKAMSPRYVWSMADGYPVVVKQFLQFCLILIYPAWVFGVLFAAAMHLLFYVTVYPVLWLLFWPVRAYQKKNHPKEYEATRQKYAKNTQRSSGPPHAIQRRPGDGDARGGIAATGGAGNGHHGQAKWTQGIEQVRRRIAVVNGP